MSDTLVTTVIVTTCMGRLAHLTETLPTWLKHTPFEVVIVDYGCPDLTTRWVQYLHTLPYGGWQRVRSILMTPDTSAGAPVFNKPRALNAAAKSVAERSPDARLLFLDADTRVHTDVSEWTARMMIADKADGPDLLGVLGVSVGDYLAIGGASTSMWGYGAEDLDVRLRLYLRRGLLAVPFPAGTFQAIAHSDELRTRFYSEKNKLISGERNLRLMLDHLTQAERDRVRTDPEAQRLAELVFLENQS